MATVKLRSTTTTALANASVVVPVLGEPLANIETGEVRIGNGVNTWQYLPSLTGSKVFNVKDFLAKGDGITNDAPAVRSAIAAASAAGGGTVYFPPATYVIQSSTAIPTALTIPANVTLKGDKGRVSILWTADVIGAQRYFALSNGANVTIEGLSIQRSGLDFYGMVIEIGPYDNFVLRDCVLDQNKIALPVAGSAGMHIGLTNGTTQTGVLIERCTIKRCGFGFYMDNGSTASISNFMVRNCIFDQNKADDLEFNAPSGLFTDIWVLDSVFSNNLATSGTAGVAVGMAKVNRAIIRGNTVTTSPGCAFHVEDDSTDVLIEGNHIINCATVRDYPIYIIGNSKRVKIARNFIDNTTASRAGCNSIITLRNSTYVAGTSVNAQAAGSGVTLTITTQNQTVMPVGAILAFQTGGGIFTVTVAAPATATTVTGNLSAAVVAGETYRNYANPSGRSTGTIPNAPTYVTITDNEILTGTSNDGMVLMNPSNCTVTGNHVIGSSPLGVSTNVTGIMLMMASTSITSVVGANNVVSGNTLVNMRTGMGGALAYISGNSGMCFGTAAVISNNIFNTCNVGMDARNNSAGVNISGNIFSGCTRPWYIGTGNNGNWSSKPISVTGNHATGCTLAMDQNGATGLIRSTSAVTVGSGVTLTVLPGSYNNNLYMGIGTVLTFTGGGVFTLTAAAQPYNSVAASVLTGNLTVANIAANENGSGTVPHSPVTADSYRLFANNVDSLVLATFTS